MRRHYLFGGGNSYSSKLKMPHLLAGGIECPVSPWDLPPSRWHDIYINGLGYVFFISLYVLAELDGFLYCCLIDLNLLGAKLVKRLSVLTSCWSVLWLESIPVLRWMSQYFLHLVQPFLADRSIQRD